MGVMAVTLLMSACASTDEIVNHFNNPPERYTTPPAPGQEEAAAALEKKLQETPLNDLKATAAILLERAKLLEGRCKRLNPGQYGAVATAASVSDILCIILSSGSGDIPSIKLDIEIPAELSA